MVKEAQPRKSNTDGDESNDFRKYLDISLNYCLSWHELYTNQRLLTFRFYVIFIAAYLAAYVNFITGRKFMLAFLLSIFSLVLNICFWLLERRNVNLINIGEDALMKIEEKLSKLTNIGELNLVNRGAEKGKKTFQKSSYILAIVFFLTTSVIGAGIIFPCLWPEILLKSTVSQAVTRADALQSKGNIVACAIWKAR